MDKHQSGILIYVSLKHPGNVTKKVREYPFFLEQRPHTFRELIEESVRTCLASYKTRAKSAETLTPLSEEQWNGMREVGKFAFGVHYNTNTTDEAEAIQIAIDAVTDGLVRVFKGQNELKDLDGPMEIAEGDGFTFVRLVMLSGSMW
ncbi:MAG: hypothetical protein ACI3XR_05895 [Eubacteriales bacterium]